MLNYKFKTIHFGLPNRFIEGSYIWIWNANKIPPHIGISQQKKYWSLTYRESEKKQTSSMLRKAKRSSIPLLLVAIPINVDLSNTEATFEKFTQAKVGGPTCLTPVKKVLGMSEGVRQLSELLQLLELEWGKLDVFALHLDERYTALPAYSIDQIMQRIGELNDIKE